MRTHLISQMISSRIFFQTQKFRVKSVDEKFRSVNWDVVECLPSNPGPIHSNTQQPLHETFSRDCGGEACRPRSPSFPRDTRGIFYERYPFCYENLGVNELRTS